MMNTFGNSNTRNKRNLLNNSFPISIDTRPLTTMNSMKHSYDGLFINNMGLIPDPLKKNLADTFITAEDMNLKKTKEKDFFTPKLETPIRGQSMDFYPKLSGLFNIFSGIISGMGAMFQRREQSPIPQYYDCFDSQYLENSAEQLAKPIPWQCAKFDVQNKSGPANSLFNEKQSTESNTDMISDSKPQFIEKQIDHLIFKNDTEPLPIPSTKQSKQFESSSVEIFEDAFCPEDTEYLQNDIYFEYNSPFCYQQEELFEAYATETKTEVKDATKESTSSTEENTKTSDTDNYNVVSSCEDKLNRLKELLKPKCTNETKSTVESETNINTDIGTEHIEDEAVFGNEISISDNTSEGTDFDEFTGKFYSSSVGSNDSYEIVFSDNYTNIRRRIPSESESEDSFIVFDRNTDNTDSCYTSSEIVVETDLNCTESTDAEDSDVEDSGCVNFLPHLSRTLEDLTDDKLYDEDVVDCAFAVEALCDTPISILSKETNHVTPCKKQKKVTFCPLPPEVHYMELWAEEAVEARKGGWSPSNAADRDRFARRIANVEMAIAWVLKPQHRTRVMFQRFMPWWNAQKRRELEEKQLAEKQLTEKQLAENTSPDECDR